MVLRSRCSHSGVSSAHVDVGPHDVAIQGSVLATIVAACSSNPYVSLIAPPLLLALIRTVGVYAAACVAIGSALVVLHFAVPPTPIAMVAGVMAGVAITPQLAACVVVWAVAAATGTMALHFWGFSPVLSAAIAATGAVLPALPFYIWQPIKKDDYPNYNRVRDNVPSNDKVAISIVIPPGSNDLYL